MKMIAKVLIGIMAIAIVGVVAMGMDSGVEPKPDAQAFTEDFIKTKYTNDSVTDIWFSDVEVEEDGKAWYVIGLVTCEFDGWDVETGVFSACCGVIDGKWTMGMLTLDGEIIYEDDAALEKLII